MPHNAKLYIAAAVILAALLFACGLSGYGPPEDRSSFVSSRATPDARFGVFSYHLYSYRPAAGLRAFPDGGIPYYINDTNTLGIYDFKSGQLRIARRDENRDFQPGQGNFRITHISNTKAVISQGGQKRSDYLPCYRLYMLDIPSGVLSPLPIDEELEALGREPGYTYLVDDAGSLVLVTAPLGAGGDYVGKESNPKEVWIRHPGGSYEKAATAVHYYPSTDGLVHFFDYEQKKYLLYDMASHAVRTPPERYPPSLPDSNFDLVVTPGDRNSLSPNRKVGDNLWVLDKPVVTEEDLY